MGVSMTGFVRPFYCRDDSETMPSRQLSTPSGIGQRTRRSVLASLGAGTVFTMAGCASVLPGGPAETEVEPAEVVVENRTDDDAEIAVRLVDGASETVFSRVFSVGPEQMVGRGAIETAPRRVHAFTPGGISTRWEYDPDLPADFDCEIKDVGLTLHGDETIEPWYKC